MASIFSAGTLTACHFADESGHTADKNLDCHSCIRRGQALSAIARRPKKEALRLHPEAQDALDKPWEHPLGYGLKEKLQDLHSAIKTPDRDAQSAAAEYLFACADMIGNRLADQIMQRAEPSALMKVE